MDTFDAVVIGLGAHGSAAALALARRGLRVAGVERFGRAHGMASSGGRTRIIRMAYFEGPAYVPLVRESWDRWQALEAEAGVSILTPTGGIYGGLAGSSVLEGSIRSAREHGLPHEVIDSDEVRRRWPVFAPPEGTMALIEEQAGVVRSDVALEAHLTLAERLGATFRFEDPAMGWRAAAGGGYEVRTASSAVLGAEHLVIASGAWIQALVPDLRLPLTIERMPLLWVEPLVPAADVAVGRLPVWIMETDFDGSFYGFPYDPEAGLKVARHHSGENVPVGNLDGVDRTLTATDVARVRRFLGTQMPGADGPLRGSAVCLYTDTPDEDFVLDVYPGAPGVAIASACSGHGFKFSPVVGEILADLALDGRTTWPVDPFGLDRFAARA
jgi:sarcosine oxidase